MSIVGRTYLERGEPVEVLVQWKGKGPRNVAIRRADGSTVVRPFRGLRKPADATHEYHITTCDGGRGGCFQPACGCPCHRRQQ